MQPASRWCGGLVGIVLLMAVISGRVVLAQDPSPDAQADFQQPPLETASQSPAFARQSQIDVPLGEIFQIHAPLELGYFTRALPSRDKFLIVIGADTKGNISRQVDTIKAVGQRLGVVDLTLVGENGKRMVVRVRVTPSISQLEAILARQFPHANLTLTAVGEATLMVEGNVEATAQIEPILNLLKGFVGPKGGVINAMRVTGVMQVQLKVIIARVDRSKLRRMGFNWFSGDASSYQGSQIGGVAGSPPINIRGGDITADSNVFGNVGGATSAALNPSSSLFFGVTDQAGTFFGYLEALKSHGVVKILATPTLVTLSGRPAEFLVGGEQPFPTAQGAIQAPTVEFKKFGTRLNFVPIVLGGGKIRIDLVPEVSTVNFAAAIDVGDITVPQFVTQRLHATVEMEEGQLLVLGGLLQEETDSEIEKIPVLGSIPLIGALFRRVRDTTRETELLVLVEPRLAQALEPHQKPCLLPGQETESSSDWQFYANGQLETLRTQPPNNPPAYQIEQAYPSWSPVDAPEELPDDQEASGQTPSMLRQTSAQEPWPVKLGQRATADRPLPLSPDSPSLIALPPVAPSRY